MARIGSMDRRIARARRGAEAAARVNRRRRCPECGKGGRVQRVRSPDGLYSGYLCGWCDVLFEYEDMKRMEALRIEFGPARRSTDDGLTIAVTADGVYQGSLERWKDTGWMPGERLMDTCGLSLFSLSVLREAKMKVRKALANRMPDKNS